MFIERWIHESAEGRLIIINISYLVYSCVGGNSRRLLLLEAYALFIRYANRNRRRGCAV